MRLNWQIPPPLHLAPLMTAVRRAITLLSQDDSCANHPSHAKSHNSSGSWLISRVLEMHTTPEFRLVIRTGSRSSGASAEVDLSLFECSLRFAPVPIAMCFATQNFTTSFELWRQMQNNGAKSLGYGNV